MFLKRLTSRISKLEKQVELIESHFGPGLWRAIDAAYDLSLPHRTVKCIVCGHEGRTAEFNSAVDYCMFGGGRLERYVCPVCDCIFGPLKYLDLDEEFVGTDYRLLYSRYSEADSTPNEIRTFHSLKPSPSGLYLDWGCGGEWSQTVSSLRSAGFDVWGFEPSMEATSGYVVKSREEISQGFDAIFSNNVIEHFRDPISQFREFRRLLKPGGLMAHSSPCYDYRYPFTRFHTLFLLGQSAHVLAERTGFKVVDIIEDDDYINYVFAVVDSV